MTNYTLKTPVTHNGKTYSDLTFRKPKTGDLLIMDAVKGEITKSVALMATLCDMPLPAFKEIELDDFNAITAIAGDALGESLPSMQTGEN